MKTPVALVFRKHKKRAPTQRQQCAKIQACTTPGLDERVLSLEVALRPDTWWADRSDTLGWSNVWGPTEEVESCTQYTKNTHRSYQVRSKKKNVCNHAALVARDISFGCAITWCCCCGTRLAPPIYPPPTFESAEETTVKAQEASCRR